MSNPAKRRGSEFEGDVCDLLNESGFTVERRVTRGKNDAGDIAGVPGAILELKATKAFALATAMKEALVEAGNARVPNAYVVLKAPRKPIAQAYVIQTLDQWIRLNRPEAK